MREYSRVEKETAHALRWLKRTQLCIAGLCVGSSSPVSRRHRRMGKRVRGQATELRPLRQRGGGDVDYWRLDWCRVQCLVDCLALVFCALRQAAKLCLSISHATPLQRALHGS